MDKVKQVGKNLNKTKNESAHNARRGAENFPYPERAVQNFNNLYNYEKAFVTEGSVPVYADLKIQDITTPCTVNPPILDVWCKAQHNNAGAPSIMLENNGLIDPITEEETEFILSEGKITVPATGCYGVTWNSGAWGVSYFNDHHLYATFYHNDKVVRTVTRSTTGIIATLGPLIWMYPAITYAYQIIEAKAGDTITAWFSEDGLDQCYPWWGCLRGFVDDVSSTTIRIDLIAIAESV